jgi:hypothetical protein
LAQTTYATPEEAGLALQIASRANDESTLARILGPKSHPILSSGDAAEDKAAEQSFVTKYDRMNRWVAMTDGSRVLYIGADNYPFPIPLAKDAASQWHFDTATGEDELIARRIGRNELLAIDATTSIANAQEVYQQKTHDGSVRQYAQAIFSAVGKQDGLHWDVVADKDSSPLGRADGLARGGAPVFDGYSFRILTEQAGGAKGGAKSYLVNGKLTGGFAVIAAPVQYQNSGIMTFILSREGVVYQKDLGADTTNVAASMKAYDTADGWTPAE